MVLIILMTQVVDMAMNSVLLTSLHNTMESMGLVNRFGFQGNFVFEWKWVLILEMERNVSNSVAKLGKVVREEGKRVEVEYCWEYMCEWGPTLNNDEKNECLV